MLHVEFYCLFAVVALTAKIAVAQSCYSASDCDLITKARDKINYQPCVLEKRTDGKTCYVPFRCLKVPCQAGGICLPPDLIFGGYYPYFCVCPVGRTGEQCQWLTPLNCVTNKCYNGGSCVVNTDGLFCSCPSGFGGWRCEIVNPCSKNPCPDPLGRCEPHNRGQLGRSCFDRNGIMTDRDM